MAYVREGYVISSKRKKLGCKGKAPVGTTSFLVKYLNGIGYINIGNSICFPKEYVGKRVKLKVEVL